MEARLCWAGPAGLGRMGFEIGSAGLGSAVPSKSLLGWAASAVRDPFRCDFWSQVAPTWMRGCAIIAIPHESGIEMHKYTVPTKLSKTEPADPRLKLKLSPSSSRVFPAASTELQSAPKCSLGPSNWCTFRYILHDLSPASLKAGSGAKF